MVKWALRIWFALNVPAPVKLPKEKYIDVENESMDDISLAEDIGYNRCLADIRRLNSIDHTAQQYEALAKEDKC